MAREPEDEPKAKNPEPVFVKIPFRTLPMRPVVIYQTDDQKKEFQARMTTHRWTVGAPGIPADSASISGAGNVAPESPLT